METNELDVFGKLHKSVSELAQGRFKYATDIQKKAIPLILEGKNIVCISPTGTGKSESVFLPILSKLAETKHTPISVIYCTPARSLNRNLLDRLVWWCRKLGISVMVRHGDTSQKERAFQRKSPPQFLVTTPETLQAILPAKIIGAALRNVKFVIVDELHELADSKRGAQLSIGLERLVEKAGEIQRVGLSATVSDPRKVSQFLCGQRPCEIVNLNYMRGMKFDLLYPKPTVTDEGMANKLYIDPNAAARLRIVKDIVRDKKTLIFVNTRSIAEILGSRLMKVDKGIAVHHGSLSRDTRIKIENAFKEGELKALVATSSLELGIDIGDINHVIQYMTPHQISRLVQRVGRSSHFVGGTASGTIICSEPDDLLESRAIVEMIHAGILEEENVCVGALDVLTHQIAGLTLDRDEISKETLFEIVKRANPYSLIGVDQFDSVIGFMNRKGLIRKTEEDFIKRTIGTRLYYYENLSTIPSVRKFFVKDAAANTNISTLDEDFVIFLEKGDLFITKGVPWRVLDIDSEGCKVIVEPSQEINAAIPDWEGEEIPTSFEVAQRVGQLRKEIVDGKTFPDSKEIKKDLKDFEKNNLKVPTDKHIVIEAWADVAVVHLHGGLKVNRTFAALIGNLLTKEFGSSVRTLVDPYRVAFILPKAADSEKIASVLTRIKDPENELKEILPKNKIFHYKFIHVGKLFGTLKQPKRISEKFVNAFADTPIYSETMREVLSDYFDLGNTKQILEEIKKKEVKISTANVKKLSNLAARALNRYHGAELIAPIEPDSEILKAFKNRILGKSTILFCTYCGHDWISYVGQLPDKIKCARCNSPMVTICDDVKDFKVYKLKRSLTEEEKRQKTHLEKIAGIIAASGKPAVIALSTYGVGPNTAGKVLTRKWEKEGKEIEDEFFIELLKAQKKFIATKRYWEAR